jgi:transcriptional regulator with PAS, ATPase and Fis domain
MVDRVLERQDLIAETKTLRRRAASPSIDEEIISKSIQMQSVLELVRAVADTDSTVLIRGESGTGKELVASEIHKSSRRASGPLVCVNCGALPEALLESELFGHEKGAFTWAIAQKPGMFELAGGGTIFLDEIGELSPALQVKLLRVLETRKFTRAGGSKMIDVNVRVICATNRDLEKARADGHFRGDLFYMLNVVEIKICPLRERTNDIPPLADKILRTISASTGIQPKPISAGAWECIMRFHWPGNVRELQNVLERSLIVCKGDEIQTADLPDYIVDGAAPNNPGPGSLKPLVKIECEYVRTAVKICGGNKSRAAKLLGIDRGTLARKLRG